MATPLAPLKIRIAYTVFQFVDPRSPTIHAKIVSISCPEMKLCLFECMAYPYHSDYRQLSRFLRKMVEIVKKNNQTPNGH